jgi:predicted nucleotidyltransferase
MHNFEQRARMQTQPHTPTKRDAEVLSHALVERFPSIDSILLCGSVARGDANQWSDIDLMITTSDPALTRAHLREALGDRTDRLSLVFFRTADFEKEYKKRGLFVTHLIKEGIPLYDRLGLLREVLSEPFVPNTDISEEIRHFRSKLVPYKFPERYNNNFLFCLSHLYSIGKAIVILALASRGVLEFNRDTAFRRFATMNPDLTTQIENVTRLRPFYSLVSGRAPEPLPFSYHSAATQMTEAVKAIESLAERATCQ